MPEPKKFICTAKCPELEKEPYGKDADRHKQCAFDGLNEECPAGNRQVFKLNPAWIWQHRDELVEIKSAGKGYAHALYNVIFKDHPAVSLLTSQDLIFLCDDGNGCFGGTVSRGTASAHVKVYTD